MGRKRISNEMMKEASVALSDAIKAATSQRVVVSVVRRDDIYEIEVDREVLIENLPNRTTTYLVLKALAIGALMVKAL